MTQQARIRKSSSLAAKRWMQNIKYVGRQGTMNRYRICRHKITLSSIIVSNQCPMRNKTNPNHENNALNQILQVQLFWTHPKSFTEMLVLVPHYLSFVVPGAVLVAGPSDHEGGFSHRGRERCLPGAIEGRRPASSVAEYGVAHAAQ